MQGRFEIRARTLDLLMDDVGNQVTALPAAKFRHAEKMHPTSDGRVHGGICKTDSVYTHLELVVQYVPGNT